MAQAVSRLPFTAEARVCTLVSVCGICGGQGGTVASFFSKSPVFPCQYHSAIALHTHISSGGLTIGPLLAAFQRYSLTPST
jgi:hypothetical protein